MNKNNSMAIKAIYIKIILISSVIFLCQANVHSEEIYLKNRDRITGEIIEEGEESISVNTEAMGKVSVRRDLIERIVKSGEEEPAKDSEIAERAEDVIWHREISASYSTIRGNTENDQLSVSFFIDRNKVHVNEITLKGNVFLSATDEETDAEKYYGMGRYAFSFGETKRWYNFYRIEGEHDRFAEIDYRLVPSTGVGYWFCNLPKTRMMAEMAIGLEHSDYRSESGDNNEVVLIPRAFLETRLFVNSKISQDITLYSSLRDAGEFRLRSETTFTNPLTDKLSLNFSFIDDYNSDPPEDAEKNDLRFTSSLSLSF